MQFEDIDEQVVNLNSAVEKKLVAEFLERQNLLLDKDVEYSVVLINKGNIIGTGSFAGRVLKCIAVDSAYHGMGLSNKIMTHLIYAQYRRSRTHLFIYTKPENAKTFYELGFYKIVEIPSKVVLMENKRNGLKDYLNEISAFKINEKVISSIVVNCNPFTFGHQYLIEHAASVSDQLNVFVVWEDKSSFPNDVRYRLVQEGVKHLKNVVVHKGKDYIISDATFPSYFIKEYSDIVETHAMLDLRIFSEYIAPALNINTRFVGEEPYCPVTGKYNSIMKSVLPANNIKVLEIPRLEVNNKAISASRVRELIRAGNLDMVRELVPQTTYNFLISEEGNNVIKDIQSEYKRHQDVGGNTMKIINPGVAGTLESSDIIISVEANEGKGMEIELKSVVENQFGNQVRKVIKETLEELGVKDVLLRANDKGALDCTIRARVLTAVYRAAENSDFKWEAK